jgi:outer membrane protein TolC
VIGLLAIAFAAPADVEAYAAAAVERHGDVRAAFHRWEAATARIPGAGALPSPEVAFGVYVRAIETRVGPQQGRIGIRQAIPWPGGLRAASRAARAQADAAADQLADTTLQVVREVADAYWTLWELRTTRGLHEEHLVLLDGLSSTVRARVETGQATLADLQQVDLVRARLADRLATMATDERAVVARLRSLVGDQPAYPTPTAPVLALPDPADLSARLAEHPRFAALAHEVEAADARVAAARADRMPGVAVGGDWIAVAPGSVASPDAGRDALSVGGGVTVPLWQGVVARDVAAARAESQARDATLRAALDDATAALVAQVAAVEDTHRRVAVVTQTLRPQAEAAFTSLLANNTVGKASLAQTLLAQRDLLELSVEAAAAAAAHARAWAALDALVGDVPRRPEAP